MNKLQVLETKLKGMWEAYLMMPMGSVQQKGIGKRITETEKEIKALKQTL